VASTKSSFGLHIRRFQSRDQDDLARVCLLQQIFDSKPDAPSVRLNLAPAFSRLHHYRVLAPTSSIDQRFTK
jgi:hypothetical protein